MPSAATISISKTPSLEVESSSSTSTIRSSLNCRFSWDGTSDISINGQETINYNGRPGLLDTGFDLIKIPLKNFNIRFQMLNSL